MLLSTYSLQAKGTYLTIKFSISLSELHSKPLKSSSSNICSVSPYQMQYFVLLWVWISLYLVHDIEQASNQIYWNLPASPKVQTPLQAYNQPVIADSERSIYPNIEVRSPVRCVPVIQQFRPRSSGDCGGQIISPRHSTHTVQFKPFLGLEGDAR
jgi:hypothetical protein